MAMFFSNSIDVNACMSCVARQELVSPQKNQPRSLIEDYLDKRQPHRLPIVSLNSSSRWKPPSCSHLAESQCSSLPSEAFLNPGGRPFLAIPSRSRCEGAECGSSSPG